jgi:hypothetical protein
MAERIGLFGIGMQLRRFTVMALALGGLSLPARAEDAIRLFAPVPAGKVVLSPPAGRTAYSPPRALVVRAAPAIRGSLKDGEPAARSTTPAAKTPWLVAPQTTPEPTHTMEAPSPPADDWQRVAPPPRVIRNAAR